MAADDPTRAALSARGFATSITALLVVLVVAAAAQLPASIAPDWLANQRDTYQLLWPQRWTYFATEEAATVGVYRLGRDGRTYRPAIQPLTSAQNLGGLSRRQYAAILEATEVADAIAPDRWRGCGRHTVAACADRLADAPVTDIDNRHGWPPLCGRLVLTREESMPDSRQVTSVARANLACGP